MPKNIISRRQKKRNRRIKRVVKEALRQRPPGPKRPLTSEWVLRLRDNALHQYPGDPSQTLKLVKRVCLRWGKPKTKRVRKCTVTGGTNLQLAVDALLAEDQGPAALRRSLFRAGVSKLSASAARTLHSKAIKLAAVKREQLAAEAEMARLERRDRLLSDWHKLVRAARLAKARAALKKHRDAKARAERLHREKVAAIKDKARRSRTDYLLYPMTARYAHIHNRWRPPWGEKKRK